MTQSVVILNEKFQDAFLIVWLEGVLVQTLVSGLLSSLANNGFYRVPECLKQDLGLLPLRDELPLLFNPLLLLLVEEDLGLQFISGLLENYLPPVMILLEELLN